MHTRSGSLFVRYSLHPDVHVTSNVITYNCYLTSTYVLRTIVRRGTIESRLTLLRNITSDCYLNIVTNTGAVDANELLRRNPIDAKTESGVIGLLLNISTTNLAACVCVSSKFDQFLPARFYFVSKRPENFVRIAKSPYAAFGRLFAFHCPLFVTKNNNLGWNRHASPHTGICRCNDHGPTVLSARGQ